MKAGDLTDEDREEILRLMLLELEQKRPVPELLDYPVASLNLFRRVVLEGGLVQAEGLRDGENGTKLFKGSPRLTPRGIRRLVELNARREGATLPPDPDADDDDDDDDDDDE